MLRHARRLVLIAVALLAPRAGAFAQSTQSYDFCGGSYSGFTGLGFCSSVVVSVAAAPSVDQWGVTHAAGAYTVSMQVTNTSGTNGSYSGSLLTELGLDNLLGPIALSNPADILIVQNSAIVCENTGNNTTGKAQCYDVKLDATAAGGVRVDLLASTTNGVNQSISSACSGTNDYLYTCGVGGISPVNKPVTIQFDVTSNLNLAGAAVYEKAQGALGSTECETGNISPSINCGAPPLTTTPEPGTFTLLATSLGLLGLGLRKKLI